MHQGVALPHSVAIQVLKEAVRHHARLAALAFVAGFVGLSVLAAVPVAASVPPECLTVAVGKVPLCTVALPEPATVNHKAFYLGTHCHAVWTTSGTQQVCH